MLAQDQPRSHGMTMFMIQNIMSKSQIMFHENNSPQVGLIRNDFIPNYSLKSISDHSTLLAVIELKHYYSGLPELVEV